MSRIEFYYDFRSPYSYFATCRMHLLAEKGAEISWRPSNVDVLLNLQQGREPAAEVLDPLCAPKRAHFMADIFRMIEYWKIPRRWRLRRCSSRQAARARNSGMHCFGRSGRSRRMPVIPQ
ncbi:MAG: DsbA family protein [Deltaproteobacteria bacterium]|nr:DsbA family protein [Deltaproteobacteria bacterium]